MVTEQQIATALLLSACLRCWVGAWIALSLSMVDNTEPLAPEGMSAAAQAR